MSMNQKRKKSPVKRIAMACSAVFVGILFLMAGSCPGGGESASAEGPAMVIAQGVTPMVPGVTSHNFGSTLITEENYDVTFTIHSAGDEVLNLTGSPLVQITGDTEFSVFTPPPLDALDPGNTMDFVIRLYSETTSFPTTFTANVTVESNFPDVPSYTFEVTGTMTGSPS